MAILFWLLLRDVTTFSRFWIVGFFPIILIVSIAIQYLIGWFMDKYKVIEDIQEWDAERNPLMTKIVKQTEKQ